ncbi:amino acid permease [Calothrix sp. PCC 7507]|uniref:amino acid permease n=1 Tax=Calothrix sp. PCC 7507 TaxID=99598 RepID=UPI00029F33D4|nr:aromatic amino acid transport family protein [Calothrix sp. PCC 7507]AFY35241.1 Tryptophan/tyrosine permease [Calothrix sp. PCC 7507]
MTPRQTVLQSNEEPVTRLFSHLEFDGKQLSHQPGSVLGSIALVAGTTIGAGILALPAVTVSSGVVPSTVLMIGAWVYALVAGLLIAEATVNTMRLIGRANVNILAMVENSLGCFGARIAGGAYLFLQYSLLIAYIAKGGEILGSAIAKVLGVQNVLPGWVGAATFTLLFGGIMYLGRKRFIEKLNSAFVAIVMVSFLGLLLVAAGQVKSTQFLLQNWSTLGSAISVIFVALFYHNVVPVVVNQLEGDRLKIRQSLVIGSVIPLIMFLAWNAVILGSTSPEMIQKTLNGQAIFDPLQILSAGGAGEWLALLVSVFSEFAIVTSFIGLMYGLLDFFQEISLLTQSKSSRRLPLYSIILLPSMSFGALNPSIFFTALDYAGTFSVSILGGIIPALMTWKQREQQQLSNGINQPFVPGGKLTLIMMIGVALTTIVKEILSRCGL